MSVSEQDVERVTELANLELTAGERQRMLADLNAILSHVAELNELDTASIPPMAQVAEQLDEAAAPPHLRLDVVLPSLQRAEALACAPDTDGAFFRVPKVIERA